MTQAFRFKASGRSDVGLARENNYQFIALYEKLNLNEALKIDTKKPVVMVILMKKISNMRTVRSN